MIPQPQQAPQHSHSHHSSTAQPPQPPLFLSHPPRSMAFAGTCVCVCVCGGCVYAYRTLVSSRARMSLCVGTWLHVMPYSRWYRHTRSAGSPVPCHLIGCSGKQTRSEIDTCDESRSLCEGRDGSREFFQVHLRTPSGMRDWRSGGASMPIPPRVWYHVQPCPNAQRYLPTTFAHNFTLTQPTQLMVGV